MVAVVAEGLDIEGRSRLVLLDGADSVDARQQPAEHELVVRIVEIGRLTAAARKQREAKIAKAEQRIAVVIAQRSDHRQLGLNQLMREMVLLENLCVAPALGPVKLGDQRLGALDADLVDAILIAVESEDAQVGQPPGALHRIDDELGRQLRERVWIATHKRLLRRTALYHASRRTLPRRRASGRSRQAPNLD